MAEVVAAQKSREIPVCRAVGLAVILPRRLPFPEHVGCHTGADHRRTYLTPDAEASAVGVEPVAERADRAVREKAVHPPPTTPEIRSESVDVDVATEAVQRNTVTNAVAEDRP